MEKRERGGRDGEGGEGREGERGGGRQTTEEGEMIAEAY